MKPETLARTRKAKWHTDTVILKEKTITTKEYNLIVDELVNIIYDDLVNKKSSPNDLYSSNKYEGGNHVA